MQVSIRMTRYATALAVGFAASAAFAGNHNYGPYPANYAEECGSCHVPYPPQRMTQSGWETQMRSLKHHYGMDASLDNSANKAVLDYLITNASVKEKNAPTDPTARLTKTRWFLKEHGSTPPKGQSFSNCNVCHTQAEKGDYSERALKTPPGWRRHGD